MPDSKLDTTFRSTERPRRTPEINTSALLGSWLSGFGLSRRAGTRKHNGSAGKARFG